MAIASVPGGPVCGERVEREGLDAGSCGLRKPCPLHPEGAVGLGLMEQLEQEGFPERVPVAAVATGDKVGGVSRTSVVAVCNDGASYKLVPALGGSSKWEELPPIPGTPREVEMRNANTHTAEEAADDDTPVPEV